PGPRTCPTPSHPPQPARDAPTPSAAPARPASPARPVRLAPPPPPPLVTRASERSGFVSGGGQRGAAGTQLPRPLVFEVRDSAGAPQSAQTVGFTGINARIPPATAAADAAGQAR